MRTMTLMPSAYKRHERISCNAQLMRFKSPTMSVAIDLPFALALDKNVTVNITMSKILT